MSRTYAIADMHGRHDLFVKAFRAIADHGAGDDDKVVVLGDFVDRGPDSMGLIRAMKSVQEQWAERLIILQGNHEAMMIECCFERAHLSWWIGNGGGATLMSYGYRDGDTLRPFKGPLAEHLLWLGKLPTAYEDEHRIYVHAGVPSGFALNETKTEIRQWMLYGSDARYRGAQMFPDKPHNSGKHIVHGHEQSEKHPLRLAHRTNLDSWAYQTGALAIGVFDDDQLGGPVDILWAVGEPG